ncbi:MAG TPA: 4-hydroxyphenylacetate 3-monooxygenase, reductase component [Candidatus Yaniella excrementavium]|nr:4-hydroxyphenylacetate 3-monooxygenase, reductase component [Candidatus Yaniella excrementavium]
MNTLNENQLEFRQAMAHLAAAVNIVTTEGPHGKLGITVTAVCSVTDSPPTVLVCVNQRSAAHDIFQKNGNVAINVLAGEQSELAQHFAGATRVPMEERFSWDIWDTDAQAPTLRDARVALVGRISDTYSRGTHTVMFVEIDSIRTRNEAEALIYDSRDFHKVGQLTSV